MKPKLIIMIGNIASGKTTWIKEHLATKYAKELEDWIVLSKDDIRRMLGAGRYVYEENIEPIVQNCLIDMLRNFMSHNTNIILDETNMDRETRENYFSLTKKRKSYYGYDYEIIAVVMPFVSYEKITKRIEYREGRPEWGNFPKEIWEEAWQRKNSKFEMPTKEEGFDKILVI